MSGKILLVEDGTKKGRQIWEALKTYGREVLWCSSEPVGPYDPQLGQPMYQIDPERLDRAPEDKDITLINLADIAIAFVEQTTQYDEAELTVEVLTREGIVCVGFSSQGEHNGTLAQAGAPIVRRKEALVSSLKTVMREATGERPPFAIAHRVQRLSPVLARFQSYRSKGKTTARLNIPCKGYRRFWRLMV